MVCGEDDQSVLPQFVLVLSISQSILIFQLGAGNFWMGSIVRGCHAIGCWRGFEGVVDLSLLLILLCQISRHQTSESEQQS